MANNIEEVRQDFYDAINVLISADDIYTAYGKDDEVAKLADVVSYFISEETAVPTHQFFDRVAKAIFIRDTARVLCMTACKKFFMGREICIDTCKAIENCYTEYAYIEEQEYKNTTFWKYVPACFYRIWASYYANRLVKKQIANYISEYLA